MKRLIRDSGQEEIFAMSKLLKKYAISEIAKLIGEFIYFSESNSSHGPRLKFYGGTKETKSTKNAPTLAFDSNGNCTVELADWMNKKNCPLAFDKTYMEGIEQFVKIYNPILLLVWFGHLDEGDALAYFHGQISFRELLDSGEYFIPEEIETLDQFHTYCKSCNFYQF